MIPSAGKLYKASHLALRGLCGKTVGCRLALVPDRELSKYRRRFTAAAAYAHSPPNLWNSAIGA